MRQPAKNDTSRFLLLFLLIFLAATRLAALGEKPYHHDESLFANYGYELSTRGTWSHHPLLHGPLQIELIAVVLKAGRHLGALGNGDAAARLPAALCGILLLLPVWGMRRGLGREGRVAAALLICVSPGIWYYSRFCRNEALFLFASLLLVYCAGRAWRSGNPARWIVASCLAAAGLVALKENSLFLLFDGVCFLALLILHERVRGIIGAPERARGGVRNLVEGSLRRHLFAWVTGLALAWLLLELTYTNFLRWNTSFAGKYAEILQYWWGQHREHRLYGEFHYHLPILALYQPFVVAALGIAAFRFLSKRLMPAVFFLFFTVMGLWIGRFGDYLVHFPAWISGNYAPPVDSPGWPLAPFHMTSPYQLGLALGMGWLTVCAAWSALDTRKIFRAWLIWWTGLSFLQYSYAGEKAPWISLHIELPAILLAAELAGSWWRGNRRRGVATVAAVGFAAALVVNLFQGYRLCFVHPAYPGEILIFNHTQPAVRDFGREMRATALESGGTAIPLIQGEAVWPLFWYIHDAHYVFADAAEPPLTLEGVALLACDFSYARRFPEIAQRFELTTHTLRQAWLPDRLRLFTPWDKVEEWESPERRELYGWAAWRALGRYLLRREMWGDPATTAVPVEVYFGRRRSQPE